MMRRMGERLRWVREAMGKTQEEMGTIVGVHQTAWGLYERGERWPDQFQVVRVLAKLKISREYLLYDTLEGVERELAIRLAAKHPELVPPSNKGPRKDRDQA